MTNKYYSLGLIGYPLEHSISPAIHMAAMQELKLSGEYIPYSVLPTPSGESQLKQLIERVRSKEITGLNVTIPHKQSIMQWLDTLTPAATAIGAVNTIYLKGGKVIGENTDAPGFLTDLKSSSLWVENGTALILGAGGAARAVSYALVQAGWEITVAARRVDQADKLINDISEALVTNNKMMKSLKLDDEALRPGLDSCNLIINTTPLGMSPAIDTNPWPSEFSIPPHIGVYDLVYNPLETSLINQAKSMGGNTRNGLGMLVEQAALAFELWTGLKPPKKIMLEAASQLL